MTEPLLPQSVAAYFAGSNAHAPEAVAGAFVPDGIVRDEGHVHEGREAIAAWAKAAAARYRMEIAPLALSEAGGEAAVRASVAGDFPGSPIALTFRFVLAETGIRSLEIGA
jgi:hypothetical protein